LRGSNGAGSGGIFPASGCKVACICAPLAVSTHNLMDFAVRLRDAGAARITLAGREPEEAAMVVLEVRVNELICARRDALAILQDLARRYISNSQAKKIIIEIIVVIKQP